MIVYIKSIFSSIVILPLVWVEVCDSLNSATLEWNGAIVIAVRDVQITDDAHVNALASDPAVLSSFSRLCLTVDPSWQEIEVSAAEMHAAWSD